MSEQPTGPDLEAAHIEYVTGDERLANVERTLAIVASVLLGEQTRSGGEPFSGQWNIITHDWRGTVDDAIDLADAALMKKPEHSGEPKT